MEFGRHPGGHPVAGGPRALEIHGGEPGIARGFTGSRGEGAVEVAEGHERRALAPIGRGHD
ncbi:MAG: hypothetical protein K2X91_15110, partial [Thermoleophilia bacterium]|nr:hypothetical protein [Thermoleophilia bacterium]